MFIEQNITQPDYKIGDTYYKSTPEPSKNIVQIYKPIKDIMTYESVRDELIKILEEVFMKKSNELYTEKNMKNVIEFMDMYFSTNSIKCPKTKSIMNRQGGIYIAENFLFIKIGEWDYGSYSALAFCVNYNEFMDFLNDEYTGNLGGDDLSLVVLKNKSIYDYKMEIIPYLDLFYIEPCESYVKSEKKTYDGHVSDYINIDNIIYAKIYE